MTHIRFDRDRRGNVAIMTALLTPMLLLAMLGGINVTVAMAERQELKNVAQVACTRAIVPLRMKILNDAARAQGAIEMFDQMAADRGLNIVERSVTSDWLTATVNAEASIAPIITANLWKKDDGTHEEGGTDEEGNDGSPSGTDEASSSGGLFDVNVSITCNGLPPYPKKGDVILSSNFTRPDGEELPMKNGTWGVYKPQEFGWEGGTGPGVEIQDWQDPKRYGTLPADSKSRYVVELDSHNGPAGNPGNSSMYRTVELHRGIYRFSFWYFGRQENAETNIVRVYLEGSRPAGPKELKLTAQEKRSAGWLYKSFDIRVETYALYKLWIAAEGTDDTTGGNFNDMKLEYIRRPNEM
jgi:hypothetical protein